MCFGGGGGGGGGVAKQFVHAFGGPNAGQDLEVEAGIPQDYIDRGATTVSQYQIMAQQDLSDKQIAAQQKIADENKAFNEQQLAETRRIQQQQEDEANAQKTRQDTYDKGRADLLAQGTQQVNDAFARFSPDYFDQYTKDYMQKATDDVNYQKALATKNLLFGLARQGLGQSQTRADQFGLLEEDTGRTLAQHTQNATDASNTFRAQVGDAKNRLLSGVTTAESIGSPIAGGTDASVNAALDTTRSAISGVANSAGDTIASFNGVPTVSPLVNVFANVLGATGSYIAGQNAQGANNLYNRYYNATVGGTNPSATSGGFNR